MRPMLRVLLGIIVGLGYGVLVGGLIFLIDLITGDSDNTSLMIDPKAILRYLIMAAMIITGSAGALVGLLVALFRAGKIQAAMIGFTIGLVIFVGVVLKAWPQLGIPADAYQLSFLILLFLVLIIMFPAGLAATGVTTSVVAAKFVSTR